MPAGPSGYDPRKPSRRDFYRDGLKLAESGHYHAAIGSYEQALAQNPNDERVLFALAVAADAIGAPQVAENFYQRVLTVSPGRLEAVVNLANLYRARGDFTAAKTLLNQTLGTISTSPELPLTLGSVLRESGHEDEAEIQYRAALAIRPHYTAALGNLADLLSEKGQNDEALALYEKLLRADPRNPQAHLNRGILHLSRGSLTEGWRDYAGRLKMAGRPIADHNLRHWNGAPRPGRKLLVSAEQGVGDQIMFASVIPDLLTRTAEMGVILECEPRLVPLFARSFPTATVHGWDVETIGGKTLAHYGWLKEIGGADSFIEIGSLPEMFRPGLSDFSKAPGYLIPDPSEATFWQATLSSLPRPWIGLCWRSGKSGGHRNREYAPLEAWANFVRTLPGTPVVTQYGTDAEEIATLEQLSGRKLFLPADLDQKNELDRTVAFLSCLDAVVSAPTAVSWQAAAVGVPVYKILYNYSWTSFGTDHEPFAPQAKCMRADQIGDWAAIFAATTAELIKIRTD
ncbi:MAG: tetratricopeptide repeat-containing glycosyltransferase family protein [Rhizomicrobium sp.]